SHLHNRLPPGTRLPLILVCTHREEIEESSMSRQRRERQLARSLQPGSPRWLPAGPPTPGPWPRRPPVLAALATYDFSAFAHVCDVGGGHGHLLCSLLGRYPHLRGTVLELPAVIADPARR